MRLSIEQIIEFQTNGVLIVKDALTDQDLQPLIDEISNVIDERARDYYEKGKIQELHENEPFERRYALLHRQSRDIGRKIDISDIRSEAMFRFLKNERLLDVVECLLGSELMCNPIHHLRAKTPVRNGEAENGYFGNVPWHQDAAVTSKDADASEMITFWLPLVDATLENGCMEVMPEVFKAGYLEHQAEGGTTIIPELLPHVKPIVAECPKGGVVIMNKYTPHRGMNNHSDHVRWSMDLRYHKTGAPSGRSAHPSFVVRSKVDPHSVLDDHAAWSKLWEDALTRKQPAKLHRV